MICYSLVAEYYMCDSVEENCMLQLWLY